MWSLNIDYVNGFWKCYPDHRTANHKNDFILVDMPRDTNILDVRRAANILFDLIERPKEVTIFERNDWLSNAVNNKKPDNFKDNIRDSWTD